MSLVNNIHKKPKCNCFTGEDFRQELLENCKGVVLVGYCCCGNVRAVIGELELVGADFIVLEEPLFIPVPTPPTTTATTAAAKPESVDDLIEPALIIPLNRIFAFAEVEPPPVEDGCAGTCCTEQTLIEHLAAEHCGDFIEVEACTCLNEGPVCIFGNLVEVGCDFVEVRVEDVDLCPGGPTDGALGVFAQAITNAKGMTQKSNIVEEKNAVNGTIDAVIRINNLCSVFINPYYVR